MVTLDDDIMQQLREAFEVEAVEHIQAMNRTLPALENSPDEKERSECLEEIFREAHSLKGAAGAASIVEVEAVAHRLEDVLGAVRSGSIDLTPAMYDVLYEGIDTVDTLVQDLRNDNAHSLDPAQICDRLKAIRDGKTTIAAGKVRAGGNGRDGTQNAGTSGDNGHVEPAVRTTRMGPMLGETIRVATSKADHLVVQAGELLVAGLRVDQRAREVEALGRLTEDWNREWLKVRAAYGHLLHREGFEETKSLLMFMESSYRRLKTLTTDLNDLRRGFSGDAHHLSRLVNDLGKRVMEVRMLPVATVFDACPRIVRDLARETGKEVDVWVEGAETELDRKVLEQIKDPLMHILRNSVDHGIEFPEKRVEAGKSQQGTITVRASREGSSVVITVTDDGSGIDTGKVKQAALKRGMVSEEMVEPMTEEELLQLIFLPGVSTSPVITDTSGRGVGMDVVRRNVEDLQGHVDVSTVLGQGTTVKLTLPLTLATTQELLVEVRGQVYGIPIAAVERILRIHHDDVFTIKGRAVVSVDAPISLVHLADILELPGQDTQPLPGEAILVIILSVGEQRIALLVDGVIGQQESVVKSLGKQLPRVRNVSGATILGGTGQVVITLNPMDLLKSAQAIEGGSILAARKIPQAEQEKQRPTVLVVDDSPIAFTLEKSILEAAGYEVRIATDGTEALETLRTNRCDLIVSDVTMPRMNGFELTAAVRSDPKLEHTPVVLVTSLESREDKERGMEVGADAYIVKSAFDQKELLNTVEQLI